MNDDFDNKRLRNLAVRLVASGPKAHAVSASECHEISEGLLAVLDDRSALIKALDDRVWRTRSDARFIDDLLANLRKTDET